MDGAEKEAPRSCTFENESTRDSNDEASHERKQVAIIDDEKFIAEQQPLPQKAVDSISLCQTTANQMNHPMLS